MCVWLQKYNVLTLTSSFQKLKSVFYFSISTKLSGNNNRESGL